MFDDDDDYDWFYDSNKDTWRIGSWVMLWIMFMVLGYWLTHVIMWLIGVK